MFPLSFRLFSLSPAFVKVLDQMRHGKLDSHSISCLKGLEREIVYEDGVDPVELLVKSDLWTWMGREDPKRAHTSLSRASGTRSVNSQGSSPLARSLACS